MFLKNYFFLIFFIVCFFTNKTFAQNNFSITLNHIALCVKDLDVSANFYANILELNEIVNKTKVEGIRWFSLGEGKELHLISTIKDTFFVNKAIHFALTSNNFNQLIQHLEAHQIDYFNWQGTKNKISVRADNIQQIFFKDPNGYWIEVNSVGQKTN